MVKFLLGASFSGSKLFRDQRLFLSECGTVRCFLGPEAYYKKWLNLPDNLSHVILEFINDVIDTNDGFNGLNYFGEFFSEYGYVKDTWSSQFCWISTKAQLCQSKNSQSQECQKMCIRVQVLVLFLEVTKTTDSWGKMSKTQTVRQWLRFSVARYV